MAITRHVFETYIRATPEKVFEALTEPAFTRQYFFGLAVNSGWEAGGAYHYDNDGPAIEGTVEEIDAPRRLVMTFRILFDADASAEPPSRVTWEITSVGDVVRVTCIHGDLAFSPVTWKTTASGWSIVLAGLKSVVETGSGLGDVPDDGLSPFAADDGEDIDLSWHRRQGIACNNGVYGLLDLPGRTDDETARMVHMAHAAVYHWDIAGTDTHRARAEYLCSHVYGYLSRAEPALHHATRCTALCDRAGVEDFDRFFAHEATARALAAAGRLDEAAAEVTAARATPIADPEDRSICHGDLVAGPWFGLTVAADV